jgi:hypothetical protein
VRIALPVLCGLILVVGGEPLLARRINLGDDSRRCLSTLVVPNPKLPNGSACVAHNSCARAVYATFDAYPLHARRAAAPLHAKVSHWLKPGDNEVFGWKDAPTNPAPECSVVETHY